MVNQTTNKHTGKKTFRKQMYYGKKINGKPYNKSTHGQKDIKKTNVFWEKINK